MAQRVTDLPDEPTPPPDLGGEYLTAIGDSVTAGSSASSPSLAWPALTAVGLNGLEQNEGQGGKGVFNYTLSAVSAADATHEWIIINLVINSVYSSPASETEPPTLGSLYWMFEDRLQFIIDDLTTKGYDPAKIVISTCYYIQQPVDNAAPWRMGQYSKQILDVCKANGCIYADLFSYMDAFVDKNDCLADPVHQNNLGHSRTADYYLTQLDWTPQADGVDPLIRYRPYFTTAASNIDFASVGVDATNIEIIYEADDPLNCYVPGKTGNTITGMVNGQSYYVVPKLHEFVDLNTVGLPHPISNPTDGSTEAAAFVAATGRASQAAAIQDFIEGLKAAGLWWRMYGFWIFDTSFNKSKYNLRDATATITEYGGAGTYDAAGWVGGPTKALLSGITPDDYDKTCTMIVSIVTDVHENGCDFGMDATATNGTRFPTRMDFTDPPVLSLAYPNWNGGGSYPLNPSTTAIARWMHVGGKNYAQASRNSVPFNNYYAGPTVNGVTIGEFCIGNANPMNVGSTKKFRLAGIFHCLDEYDQYVLDGLVETFEAAL